MSPHILLLATTMPVYVNRIFNNTMESEEKFSLLSLGKNAKKKDESQGAFTMMGTEIFILCEFEPGF